MPISNEEVTRLRDQLASAERQLAEAKDDLEVLGKQAHAINECNVARQKQNEEGERQIEAVRAFCSDPEFRYSGLMQKVLALLSAPAPKETPARTMYDIDGETWTVVKPPVLGSPEETPTLMTYMTTDSPIERDAAYLRTYAARVRNGTELTWDIPNTRAATLEDIATRMLTAAPGRARDEETPK